MEDLVKHVQDNDIGNTTFLKSHLQTTIQIKLRCHKKMEYIGFEFIMCRCKLTFTFFFGLA